MIIVLARNFLKPGCRDAFIRLYQENLPNVLAEKGCIQYQLTQNADSGLAKQTPIGENTLIFVECWESIEALHAHLAAPHMKAFAAAASELRESSELRIVTPVC